jgi:hypothetical protein
MPTGNGKNDIVMKVISAIPVFVYFLFFVGYTYSEAYLRKLGIPVSLINYDFLDYAYFGAHVDNLVITLVFTVIFFGLIWYLFSLRPTSDNLTYKKRDLVFSISYLIYSTIVLSVMTLILIFNSGSITHPAMVVGVVTTSMLSTGLAVLLFTDRGLIQRIKRGKRLSPLFVSAVVIILICFPYVFTSAWGSFKAFASPYKDLGLSPNTLVEISASHPLTNEIDWELREGNLYVTTDELFLILENDSKLFIKTSLNTKLEESKTYIISTSDIVSYSIKEKVSDNSDTESSIPPPN